MVSQRASGRLSHPGRLSHLERDVSVPTLPAAIAIGIVKVAVFGFAGVMTAQVIAFALLIGFVALPGAFLARAFVERMPVHVHTAILDAVVLLGGVFLVYRALR